MYEICDHTADLGIRVRAPSLAALFADAASGLTAVMGGAGCRLEPAVTESFAIAGTDVTWLLCDWLGEVHAAFEVRRMLFRDFEVAVSESGLEATARGARYDPARHSLAHEVKAVTQHDLAVQPTADGWEARFIVDI